MSNRWITFLALLCALPLFADEACLPLTRTTRPLKGRPLPIVQVYWDVSGSVDHRLDPEVNFLIANIDSRILQLAGAAAPIRHFSVGNRITEAPSAAVARVRREGRSDLHDAVLTIAESLGRREIGAAILVTDLEVDRPDLPKGVTAVCHDVPNSTNAAAGPLIGRCFAAGWRFATSNRKNDRLVARPIDDLLISIFRSQRSVDIDRPPAKRHLYVLLLATDVDFAHRILAQFTSRAGAYGAPRFDEWKVVDTEPRPAIALSWSPGGHVRIAEGYHGRCAFACYAEDADIPIMARATSPSADTAIAPARSPVVDATMGTNEIVPNRRSVDVKWTLSCGVPRRTLHRASLQLDFGWETAGSVAALRKRFNIDHPDVEDVLLSLLNEIPPLLAKRSIKVSVGLR